MERSGVGRTGAEWRAGVRGEGGEEGGAGRVAKEWGGAEESVEEWEEREEGAGIWTRGQGGRTGRERRGAGRERKKGRARGGFPPGGLGRRPEGPEVPWRFPVSLEVSVAPRMPLRRSPEVFGGALMQQKTKNL